MCGWMCKKGVILSTHRKKGGDYAWMCSCDAALFFSPKFPKWEKALEKDYEPEYLRVPRVDAEIAKRSSKICTTEELGDLVAKSTKLFGGAQRA